MISQSGKNILQSFVSKTKDLLLKNTITILQAQYGIWQDGHTIPVEKLSTNDTEIIHVARMLRERLKHITNSLPDTTVDKDRVAVDQLIAEQAFTILNRFCALRMCEERELIFESIRNGYNSAGFISYDAVTGGGAAGNLFTRYKWYIYSIFDELSVELPAIFNRFSPYCLIFPEETTLIALLDLINAENLNAFYDGQTGETINFWKEDETIGWIYQYYNSLEERRKMRLESDKPRNSREMAVRNQFFTPEYVVKFLTDNTLGRIWYEMTGGKSKIYEICEYMAHKPNDVIEKRELKEPTEIRTMDPTCGSMHFGLYAFGVYEYIYMDAWDNHPGLLQEYRYTLTREEFKKLVPSLILEKNIYGCEIDPRALQMAALSLWLRAQRSYNEMSIPREYRPLIRHSNLVLAEPMPGNKKLLKLLMSEFDVPMQRLISKIWDKMQYVGEAGLLIKMEQEIEREIADLRKNWYKVNKVKDVSLFSSTKDEEWAENERIAILHNVEAKEAFFAQITIRLQDALRKISEELTADEGYENALFAEDATRGFAFIELCQQRFDVIVMNPPFGESSLNTVEYLKDNYPAFCGNLVCSFFERMQEMLLINGLVGAIFDRTVQIKSSYEKFRTRDICGHIVFNADTGEGVLDANVSTSTLVLSPVTSDRIGTFFNVYDDSPDKKSIVLKKEIANYNAGIQDANIYEQKSIDFLGLPNSIIGYYMDEMRLSHFLKTKSIEANGYTARNGNNFVAAKHPRVFYELTDFSHYKLFYNGGGFSMFYKPYNDVVYWDYKLMSTDPHVTIRNVNLQLKPGVGFGKRGEILDAHILKANSMFSSEGLAFPDMTEDDALCLDGLINSVFSQYNINLYCEQHKGNGYVNLLPMPNLGGRRDEILQTVRSIIELKRKWYSYDETNLEYRGFIGQLSLEDSISSAFDLMQEQISSDYALYYELVQRNDDIWMDLANIPADSKFRQILNNYKSKRSPEELLSIDNASNNNILNKRNLAQEFVLNLVGIVFGRWDLDYVNHNKSLPSFSGILEALPFVQTVALQGTSYYKSLEIPSDGILLNDSNSHLDLTVHIRNVMHVLWPENADNFEYELCHLLAVDSLSDYIKDPNGFFAYHYMRYIKGPKLNPRRAPIYWPLSSQNGLYTVWVYYPKLTQDTLPKVILLISKEIEEIRSLITAAQLKHDVNETNRLRIFLSDLEKMSSDLGQIIAQSYRPNHEDGVPITAAPLANLFANNQWREECKKNLNLLNKGEYDWSHLAYSMFPLRIRTKAQKDWCLALTHDIPEFCVNKPKEKKARAKKSLDNLEEQVLF